MKPKCGPNGQKFSGFEMETETPDFFIAKLLNGVDVIISRDYIIKWEDGAQNRGIWWTRWWIFIKNYLPPQIRIILIQFGANPTGSYRGDEFRIDGGVHGTRSRDGTQTNGTFKVAWARQYASNFLSKLLVFGW